MPKTLVPYASAENAPSHALLPDLPPVRRRRRAMIGAVIAVLAVAGVGVGVWRYRAVQSAAPDPTALQPTEARLLAVAGREPKNPQPYLELGESYAGAGQPASAVWAYGEAAARAPADGVIGLKLAAALQRLGYNPAAERILRSVITGGGPAADQARFDLADLLLLSGRPTEARAVPQGDTVEAVIARGRAHEAAGDTAAARRAYRQAVEQQSPEACERLARLELAVGRLPAAQEAVRTMAKLRAVRPEDLLLVAAIHAAPGTPASLDTAGARLRHLLEQQPRNAEARYQMALLAQRRGDRFAAMIHLLGVVKLNPGHAEARGRLADVLAAMGQTQRARGERATYYSLRDQPDQALAELQRIPVSGEPDDRDRTLTRIRLLRETRRAAAALKEAQAGLRRHPGDPQLMLQLGLMYQPGEWRAALEQLCRDWIGRDPKTGTPYWLLGRQAVGDNRIEEAIRHLTTACEKEPARADFHTALALAYMANSTPENLARARPWLEKAIALNPRSPGPHQHLGRILEQTGDFTGARRQYLQSLDAAPAQPTALNNLARVVGRVSPPEVTRLFAGLAQDLREQGQQRSPLADRVYQRPTDAAAHLALARFLIRNGQLTAARSHLERAAAASGAAAPARQALAQLERLLRVQAGT